ncbi:MAG: hypothetical protein KKE73_04265 [Proteobacteria bacterium]|nr:hypothetical protein [Pseudomonadota bacterium]
MGKSQKDRQAEYEERLKERGGRIVKATLGPNAAAVLDDFKQRHPNLTQSKIIEQAILTLETMRKHLKDESDQAVVILGKHATQKLDELVEEMQHTRTRREIVETAIAQFYDDAKGGLE